MSTKINPVETLITSSSNQVHESLNIIEKNTVQNEIKQLSNKPRVSDFNATYVQPLLEEKKAPANSAKELVTRFEKIISDNINKSVGTDINSLAALFTRILRFRIKYGIVYRLFVNSPRKNFKLKNDFDDIWDDLCRTKVYWDSTLAPKGLEITILSTVNLVKRKLTHLESQIKYFIGTLTSLYDVPNYHHKAF